MLYHAEKYRPEHAPLELDRRCPPGGSGVQWCAINRTVLRPSGKPKAASPYLQVLELTQLRLLVAVLFAMRAVISYRLLPLCSQREGKRKAGRCQLGLTSSGLGSGRAGPHELHFMAARRRAV